MTKVTIERLITGTLIREGAGVKLHRYIGADRSNSLEPILLFDYFDSSNSLDFMGGFPPHPHRGFETITYLLQGSITHEDNKGHKGVIGPGDVQWMTAGRGIMHSEMPSLEHERLQGLQLWLNLPSTQKMSEPRYQELANEQLPIETHESGARIKVIAGSTNRGTQSPIKNIATQPLFFDIHLPQQTMVSQRIAPEYQTLLFVLSGQVRVEQQAVNAGVLAVLSAGEELHITGDADSQCLLISAAQLKEPIARHGPFVMNTQEEIAQAIADFRAGHF